MNLYDLNRSYPLEQNQFGLVTKDYKTELGVNPNYQYSGKPVSFSDIVNKISEEERTAKMSQNEWEKPARIVGGLSSIASGDAFGKAAGLSSMFGNEGAAESFGNIGSIAKGDAFGKASGIANMTGNSGLASGISQVGQWQDPKSAALSTLTKGVGGPMGMVIGMAAQKATDDTGLRQNIAQGEYNTKRQVSQGERSLREQQLANMQRKQPANQNQFGTNMPFGNALIGGIV